MQTSQARSGVAAPSARRAVRVQALWGKKSSSTAVVEKPAAKTAKKAETLDKAADYA